MSQFSPWRRLSLLAACRSSIPAFARALAKSERHRQLQPVEQRDQADILIVERLFHLLLAIRNLHHSRDRSPQRFAEFDRIERFRESLARGVGFMEIARNHSDEDRPQDGNAQLATGAIRVDEDTPCLGCNRIRGYIYTGPAYTEKNFILTHHICPWCIADGTAAKLFGASFTDTAMIDVPDAVRKEIEQRTPGFHGWQQEEWLACCDDGAAFLGVAGNAELRRDFPDAIPAVKNFLKEEMDLEDDDAEEYFESLQKGGEPSAYVFRCMHCGKYLAYVDQS